MLHAFYRKKGTTVMGHQLLRSFGNLWKVITIWRIKHNRMKHQQHNIAAAEGSLCYLGSLDITVEWLSSLLHIQEFPGSILGPETGSPDRDFTLVFSGPLGRCQDSTLSHSHFFPYFFHFTYQPIIQYCIIWTIGIIDK
jgi:hypothetical protein